jgi:hypothetical protein
MTSHFGFILSFVVLESDPGVISFSFLLWPFLFCSAIVGGTTFLLLPKISTGITVGLATDTLVWAVSPSA